MVNCKNMLVILLVIELNSILMFDCKQLSDLMVSASWAPRLGKVVREPKCFPFSTCRRFRPPNFLPSYGNPHPAPLPSPSPPCPWPQYKPQPKCFPCFYSSFVDFLETAHLWDLNYLSMVNLFVSFQCV